MTTEAEPQLHDQDGPESLTLAVLPDLECNTETRTISGTVLPYGVLASRTSAGAVMFQAGAIRHHPDLRRVKLLLDHDPTRAVGYCTQISQDENGVQAVFHVPSGQDGDEALAKARDGIRDGLSVGVDITRQHRRAQAASTPPAERHLIVTEATLNEVSLVSLPAYTDARVLTVKASYTDKEHTMTDDTTTPDHDQDTTETTAPAAVAEPIEAAAAEPVRFTRPVPQVTPHPAPYAMQAGRVSGPSMVEAAVSTISDVLAQGGDAHQVRAALSDVVPSNDAGGGYLREQWLGELWSASAESRPFIDALAHGTLTGPKIKGWRWTTKPEVADYAGGKAEVPSNAVATEAAEADVKRMAGGWDVDRIYLDLGDPAMVQALFVAAVADYRRKTEAAIGAAVAADATALAGAGSLTESLGLLGSAAAGAGSSLSFVFMAPDVWATFIGLDSASVPWWLRNQGTVSIKNPGADVADVRIGVNRGLAAGQVLAGDRRAVTFYEPAGAHPVRVQAQDIPHGGVDLGVFGYYGHLTHDPAALFKVAVSGGAGAAAMTTSSKKG